MKPIEIKGETTEQKFTHIERILQRFSRRLHKTVIGLIPASPVFGYCENPERDPIVLMVIFPADGIITQSAAKADECGKNARITVDVVSGDETLSRSFPLKPRAVVEEVNFPIKAGDTLTVKVSKPEDENVEGVWVGLLYQVGIKDLASTKFLIDQFEALIEDQNATD